MGVSLKGLRRSQSSLCVGDCRQCRDAMRYGAMLILAKTAAAHYLTGFKGTVASLQGREMASQTGETREAGLVLAVVCAANP